ncbi:methylated-DNA--[protein]-cysteine S-methyltransferase [Paenibacillus rigui]|uniref:Methylated-DNA--protein-cysteine methyltransferase n=1 Tax=Paenibacillus rigui TaxID=554312 RepID=A0A229UNJ0_9BACL|nr:methylated-DNA--[protein]-cysteine S-methyltransferase [Paenibacillus rigui]OXM84952.1 [Fe-S]-binding protein [Paenibacillus rigui]
MSVLTIQYMELDSPIGPLVLASAGSGLCHIEFGRFDELTAARLQSWSERWYGTRDWRKDEADLRDPAVQLKEYFHGDRKRFDVQLDLQGTPFQLKVWDALGRIPYGTVCSYKDIGQTIDSVKAVRAIGGANNQNPIPVIIPCHRVIGADGSMVGYGGGLEIKSFLLQHEGITV